MSSEQNFKKSKVAKVAKKGLFRIVFSRTGIMLLLILIQLGIFIMIPYYLNAYTTYIYGAFRAVSLLVLIHIITLANEVDIQLDRRPHEGCNSWGRLFRKATYSFLSLFNF